MLLMHYCIKPYDDMSDDQIYSQLTCIQRLGNVSNQLLAEVFSVASVTFTLVALSMGEAKKHRCEMH